MRPAGALLVLLAAVAGLTCDRGRGPSAGECPSRHDVATGGGSSGSALVPRSFAELAAQANPAVVSVATVVERRGHSGQRRVIGEGEGSAFVYEPSGLILTNFHVIDQAAEIRVVLGDQQELSADVVGKDAPTDIAVLRVAAKGLPFLPLGDSDQTRVGDWVVAIGNPFGLSHTVSAGIVSAKARTARDVRGLADGAGYYSFIQTDASINPGNSGGPLLDLAGRVIGINTAIRAEANNIGFAIPINMVRDLLPRLVAEGTVRRSAIGISVTSVAANDVKELGLSSREGAVVRRIMPGSPGERAGLRVRDVVVRFGARAISGPEQLRWWASLAGVGKRVELGLIRERRRRVISVVLGALSPNTAPPGSADAER